VSFNSIDNTENDCDARNAPATIELGNQVVTLMKGGSGAVGSENSVESNQIETPGAKLSNN